MVNTVLKHILSCRGAEELQRDALERHAGITLEPIKQGAGVCGDARVTHSENPFYPVGTKIEFKNDKRSMKTGNFFLEHSYTRDSWCSQVVSGALKAANEGCVLVLQCGVHNYVLAPEQVQDLIAKGGRTVGTGCGVNGNLPGLFTRGLLVRVSEIEQICIDEF